MTDADGSGGITRRRLLAAGSAAAAAAGTGCTAAMPPLGQRVQYGRVDVPEAGDPWYRRWLPPKGEPGYPHWGDAGNYLVTVATPNRLGRDVLGEPIDLPGILASQLDYFGVGFENYDRVVGSPYGIAVEAEFDRTAVEETVAGTGYESSGTYRGYSLFGRSDSPRTVAVGEGSLAFTQGSNRTEAVRSILDAGGGRGARYHETDQTFESVSSHVGASPFAWLSDGGGRRVFTRVDGSVPEPVRDALSVRFDADAVYYVHEAMYPEGDVVGESELRDVLEENDRAVDSTSVDVSVDGRFAAVEMHLTPAAFRRQQDGDVTPQITWGFDRDRTAGTLTVRHEAGESVDSGALTVTGGGIEDGGGLVQFADRYDTVEPGDALTVGVGGVDDRVRIVYESEDSTSVLAGVEV